MNDFEKQIIEPLARVARNEQAPAVDVRFGALQAIRKDRPRRARPLGIFAAVSAAAAILVLAIGVYTHSSATQGTAVNGDPIAELVTPVQVELW